MKDLKSEIEMQQEALNTRKYVLSRYEKAYSGKLTETGDDVYLIDDKPENFPHIRFLYDANKAEHAVRPYLKLKRKGKPDILVYSTVTYPCSPRAVTSILNDYAKTKKFEDLPASVAKAMGENTIPKAAVGALERNINMFAKPTAGMTPRKA